MHVDLALFDGALPCLALLVTGDGALVDDPAALGKLGRLPRSAKAKGVEGKRRRGEMRRGKEMSTEYGLVGQLS